MMRLLSGIGSYRWNILPIYIRSGNLYAVFGIAFLLVASKIFTSLRNGLELSIIQSAAFAAGFL
jgi:hypothetical protein